MSLKHNFIIDEEWVISETDEEIVIKINGVSQRLKMEFIPHSFGTTNFEAGKSYPYTNPFNISIPIELGVIIALTDEKIREEENEPKAEV